MLIGFVSPSAWSQERCEAVFSLESLSEYALPLDQMIREEFGFQLSENYLQMIDQIVNQKKIPTAEQKEMFHDILKSLALKDMSLRKKTENLLGRKLSVEELTAVKLARGLGRSEKGLQLELNGFSGNYTEIQLERKDRILELAGFPLQERLALQARKITEDELVQFSKYDLLEDEYALTSEQTVALNQKVLLAMKEYAVPSRSQNSRKQFLTSEEAKSLFEAVTRHPVARLMNVHKYDPDGNIGFCFGRAMTSHLEALSRGVDKNAIRKVFVAGQMKAVVGKTVWQFHVATAVKGPEDRWWIIDPFVGKVIDLDAWYAKMKAHDIDGKLRLHVTEASRFGAYGNQKYNQRQLTNDFYNGYFKALVTFYQQKARGELPPKSLWLRTLDWILSVIKLGI